MKFIVCDMVERAYLINVRSICGIAIDVAEKDGSIIVQFTIDTFDNVYELQEDITFIEGRHSSQYIALKFANDVAKILYRCIDKKNYIDLNDVVILAHKKMHKTIKKHI